MVINEVEFLGRKSVKIESDESKSEDNSNSDSEISLEKIRTDVLSSFIKNKKRRLESPVRHTSSGKIYVEEMYWQDTSINQTNQLLFDIDGNCIFEVPINTDKRFDSTKDGRHWGPLRESKRSGFSGDRYIATCRGSFEGHNENCLYLTEFKKVNRRQFSSGRRQVFVKAVVIIQREHPVKQESFGSFLFLEKKCS